MDRPHATPQDLHITVEHVIAENDLIAVHWTARSACLGHMLDISRMGSPETVRGMTLSRLARNKIVESWTSWDTAVVLRHPGVTIPESRETV